MDSRKMHLNEIVGRLALSTGVSKETAEEFLIAFIAVFNEAMKKDKKVSLSSFGDFLYNGALKTIQLEGYGLLTETANSPFSAFEPIELSDNFPDDEDKAETIEETETVPAHALSEDIKKKAETKAPSVEPQPEKPNEPEKSNIPLSPPPVPTQPQEAEHEPQETIMEEPTVENNGGNIKPWVFWGGLIIGVCLGFIAGFLLRPVMISDSTASSKVKVEATDETNVTDSVPMVSADSVKVQPEAKETQADSSGISSIERAPVYKEVLDTVQPGRFLTKMSRRHYDGRYEFWIYIYEENKDLIMDPQNVPVGTVLKIPPREKYDIRPNSPESIEKAKRRTEELTGR